jgi:CelD/BcsL family acetyltransferase involved in cellulose biosynthesis
MIEPGDDSLPDLISRLSKNRREKIRRNSRKLNKRGDVSFHVIRDPAACLNARHTFLDLEDQGWKKEGGHSLKSHTHTYDFFLDMSQRFAEAGRICFTELKVNDLVVASSCNLLSGRVGIGFKAGWESDFASLAIGNLHAVELARHAPETLADLEYFDSGTGGNSWLKALWPTSRRMTTGILTGSRLTSATVSSLLKVRSVPVL